MPSARTTRGRACRIAPGASSPATPRPAGLPNSAGFTRVGTTVMALRPRAVAHEVSAPERVVLIIEDDVMTRSLLAGMLEPAGYSILLAADVTEAQRLFEAGDPDGVIVDVDLGHGINGFDLADAFRRHSPALAIVFLTHIPSVRFLSRNRVPIPEGAAYLRKDQLFNKDILLDALEAALLGQVTGEHRHDAPLDRPDPALSRTQTAVMHLFAQGHTTKEIARIRGTSVRTVQDVINRSRARLALDGVEDTTLMGAKEHLPPDEIEIPVVA